MRRYLLLGSAPYIKDWYWEHRIDYIEGGCIICAINNAWSIAPNEIDVWFHSSDFFKLGRTVKPDDKTRSKMWEVTHYFSEPVWYDKEGSGTMILNVLSHLLNKAIYNEFPCEVYCAGTDFIYTGVNDHFYGKGTPDPLRFGKEYLVEQLTKMDAKAKEVGSRFFNASGKPDTLLPFEIRCL